VTNDGGQRDPAGDAESEPFGTWPDEEGFATSEAGDHDPADADADIDADLDADFADEDLGDEAVAAHTALPPKVEAWRRRSATGAVLTGFALGLQQALGKEIEQPAIIMQTSGDPPMDLPVEADVEHGRPRQSVVNIRPWLLPTRTEDRDTDADAGSLQADDRTIGAGDRGTEDT
jgi:hypothetical protein